MIVSTDDESDGWSWWAGKDDNLFNQNYNKILKRDSVSAARFEH